MRLSKTSAFLIIGVVLLGGCVTVRLPGLYVRHSSEAETLTWTKVVRTAVQLNPDLVSARYVVTASARSRDIAAADYLPSVSGDLQRSVSRSSFSGGGSGNSGGGSGGGGPRDNLALDLVGTQSLFNGFGTTGNVLKASKDLGAAKLTYVITSAGVRNQLLLAYIDVLRWNSLLKVDQMIADRRKKNSEMVRLLYESGRENLGASMRVEALSDQAVYYAQQAERHIESQSIRLIRETGGEFALPVTIDDSLEKMIAKTSIKTPRYAEIAEKTPQVRRLIKVAESLKAVMITAQSSLWPQIDGSLDYGKSGQRASQLSPEHFLGIKMSIPFFNGGKNVNAIRKAKADYEAARSLAVSARNEVVAQLAGTSGWAASRPADTRPATAGPARYRPRRPRWRCRSN